MPSELAVFPPSDPSDAGFLRFNGTTHPDASFNPTQKAVLPVFPNLTEEDRGRMTFANVGRQVAQIINLQPDIPAPVSTLASSSSSNRGNL